MGKCFITRRGGDGVDRSKLHIWRKYTILKTKVTQPYAGMVTEVMTTYSGSGYTGATSSDWYQYVRNPSSGVLSSDTAGSWSPNSYEYYHGVWYYLTSSPTTYSHTADLCTVGPGSFIEELYSSNDDTFPQGSSGGYYYIKIQ